MAGNLKNAKHLVRALQKNYLKDLAVLAIFLIAAAGAYLLQEDKRTFVSSTAVTEAQDEIVQGNRDANEVIFSFDGGSGAESGEAILSTLKKHGAIGTFFLTGKFAEGNPELVKKIAGEGHEIWNHTYSHRDLTTLSDAEIQSELARADDAIRAVTGKSTKPYFRAPYGARNERVLAVAKEAGYRSVYWTTDVLDWKESEGFTAEQAKARIFANLEPGALYLMHLGDGITGAILDEVLTEIETMGYFLVSLTGAENIARTNASIR